MKETEDQQQRHERKNESVMGREGEDQDKQY